MTWKLYKIPISVSVIKTLLEHIIFIYSCIFYVCFCASTAVTQWGRACCSQSLKYLLAGPSLGKLPPALDYVEGVGLPLLQSCFSRSVLLTAERQGAKSYSPWWVSRGCVCSFPSIKVTQVFLNSQLNWGGETCPPSLKLEKLNGGMWRVCKTQPQLWAHMYMGKETSCWISRIHCYWVSLTICCLFIHVVIGQHTLTAMWGATIEALKKIRVRKPTWQSLTSTFS